MGRMKLNRIKEGYRWILSILLTVCPTMFRFYVYLSVDPKLQLPRFFKCHRILSNYLLEIRIKRVEKEVSFIVLSCIYHRDQ